MLKPIFSILLSIAFVLGVLAQDVPSNWDACDNNNFISIANINCRTPHQVCSFPHRYGFDFCTHPQISTVTPFSIWNELTISSPSFSLFYEFGGVAPSSNANNPAQSVSIKLYGPFVSIPYSICNEISNGTILPLKIISITGGFINGNLSINYGEGKYLLEVSYEQGCTGCVTLDLNSGTSDCNDDFTTPSLNPCETCIGSFAPAADAKYLVSAWAKHEITSSELTTYSDPEIVVDFLDATGAVLAGLSQTFNPKGALIDGWQRIEEEFYIPTGTISLRLSLTSLDKPVLFDDVRVLPFDGSMKSYVYDPVNMRLAAELDERHYATLYEYDEQGNLVRVKKETERGVMTIKESKSNSSK